MAISPQQQLRLLQRTLYEKAFQEANSLAAISSPKIAGYSKKFEASLPNTYERVSQSDLISRIRQARYILYGDFHTLRQSQRGLMRILRAYLHKYKSRKVALFLEVFRQQDQSVLDRYMNGTASQEELLRETNYSRDWGFPWHNYQMLLEFAREHTIPVFGINSDNAGRDSLATRDRFAAEIIAKYAEENPDHRLFCMIGEYHLADAFLPKQLALMIGDLGAEDLLRIVNNIDKYYFELESSPHAMTTEYLQLDRDFFCIINSPPWIKWQSVTIWDEMRELYNNKVTEEFLDDELDDYSYTESAYDIDYQFLGIIKNVMGFLGIKIDDRALDHFTIHTFPDDALFAELRDRYFMQDDQVAFMIERVTLDGAYLMNQGGVVLLTRFTLNNMAEAAGQYLQFTQSHLSEDAVEPAERFYRRVLKAAAGMIASLVMNPKRKSHDLVYYKRFVKLYEGRKLRGHKRERRDLARMILRHQEWMYGRLADHEGKFGSPMTSLYRQDEKSYGEYSRALGNLLGTMLYRKLLSHSLDAVLLRRIYIEEMHDRHDVWRLVSQLFSVID